MEDIDYTDDFSKSRQNRPRMFFNTNDYEEHQMKIPIRNPYDLTELRKLIYSLYYQDSFRPGCDIAYEYILSDCIIEECIRQLNNPNSNLRKEIKTKMEEAGYKCCKSNKEFQIRYEAIDNLTRASRFTNPNSEGSLFYYRNIYEDIYKDECSRVRKEWKDSH